MSRQHGRAHGRILEVTEETLGSTLAQNAAAGATMLYVDDAADFEDDGSGGWLSINDQVAQYGAVDDDAGTITLSTALKEAADDGDPVYVWSKLYDTAATIKTALVQVDGDDDNTDPITATLADAVQDLPEGLRGEAGENCTLHQVSADEWEVMAVGGRPSSTKGASAVRFATDSFTVTTAGAQEFILSHAPAADSQHEHVRWHPDGGAGLAWDNSQWSRDGASLTIPDANGIIAAGDKITVKYAYLVGVAPAPAGVSLDWQSTGWKYRLAAKGATFDASPISYDDSSWPVGQGAFGLGSGAWPSSWPLPEHTTWDCLANDLWVRRTFSLDETAGGVTISVRNDAVLDLYWNGAVVHSSSPSAYDEFTVTITADQIQDQNVLAICARDSNRPSYLDVRVMSS